MEGKLFNALLALGVVHIVGATIQLVTIWRLI